MTHAAGHDGGVQVVEESILPEALPGKELLARYGGEAPRYTSYPTAPCFTDFTPDQEQSAWREMPARPLSLYVHLPFCRDVCLFCGCHAVHTRDERRSGPYLADLEREIVATAARLDGARPVVQLHWGGGTPTFLGPDEMAVLSRLLRTHFAFDAGAECGIEIDPRVVCDAQLEVLRSEGFKRVSLGVQDLDPAVQQAVHRIQPREMTEAVVARVRAHGFTSVSIDLIHGLPRQTRAGFRQTVDAVVAMAPDRISLFAFAYLPERIRHQRAIDPAELPAPEERLAMWADAVSQLAAAGYRHVGMDHFARPDDDLCRAQDGGTLQRNFQGYSTHGGCDLLGFGVSAISSLGRCYAQNEKDLPRYGRLVRENGRATVRGLRLSDDDLVRREVIMELMCHFAVDWGATGFRPGPAELAALDGMARDGLLEHDPYGLRVLGPGRFFIRRIARVFDAHAAVQPTAYSRTF
ncbi:MAG: oxygen-independent coproporphyrinogen III oxidase [Candidatus Methylacidiphilales bacterium]|nr:oxygen-independent coproporphyrinogen III oxidase [Candidatus Methylacidiphilales bacterium]